MQGRPVLGEPLVLNALLGRRPPGWVPLDHHDHEVLALRAHSLYLHLNSGYRVLKAVDEEHLVAVLSREEAVLGNQVEE